MKEIYVYTNTGRVFRIVENDEGKVSIITNGQIVYEDKPAVEMVNGEILVRCEKCNALIETTVHCDVCGTFEPTRRSRKPLGG